MASSLLLQGPSSTFDSILWQRLLLRPYLDQSRLFITLFGPGPKPFFNDLNASFTASFDDALQLANFISGIQPSKLARGCISLLLQM
jgi:hypothetical protein